MSRCLASLAALLAVSLPVSSRAQDAAPGSGAVLPFPPVPSASIAGPTLQESKHVRRAEPDHLPKDAPNILIVLLDDVGFGLPEHVRRRDRDADPDPPRQ